MATYSLDGDRSGLPRTKRGGTPYEIDVFNAPYTRKHGPRGSAVHFKANQLWADAPVWADHMVGVVEVVVAGSTPSLSRKLPEHRIFRDRNLWCTALEYGTQAGPPTSGINHADALEAFPATRRVSGPVTFENVLWDMLTDTQAEAYRAEAHTSTTGYGGVKELYRYLQRQQRGYSTEQRIPAASDSGGFKIAEGALAGKFIGQVGFKKVSMADVVYKWMRVPLGWPPKKGWVPPGAAPFWPPRVNPSTPAAGATQIPARDLFKGTVNEDWWDVGPIRGYAWPPETLRYVGYDDSNQYWDAAGTLCCDYVFNFQFIEGGWNRFLNAIGERVRVSLDGTLTGTQPYSKKNFNYLFEYEA